MLRIPENELKILIEPDSIQAELFEKDEF